MGQIANQMLLEWCHKMAQKIAERIERKKSISEKGMDRKCQGRREEPLRQGLAAIRRIEDNICLLNFSRHCGKRGYG